MTTLLERNALVRLLDTLDGSHVALQRENGELAIHGKFGHIYAGANGYLLCVVSDRLSTRCWHMIKGNLHFCRLTQDGDSEGCLLVDRLPNATEAVVIRESLGIRKRRTMTADGLAALERARASINSAFSGCPAGPPNASEALPSTPFQ
jgi:hypothetical protein